MTFLNYLCEVTDFEPLPGYRARSGQRMGILVRRGLQVFHGVRQRPDGRRQILHVQPVRLRPAPPDALTGLVRRTAPRPRVGHPHAPRRHHARRQQARRRDLAVRDRRCRPHPR